MHTDVVLDPTNADAAYLLAAARVVEDAGLDGIWTYDHISGASLGGSWVQDPWTLLGAFAAITNRVTLGPLVANVAIRHPALLAVAAATLQDVSGGRAMLGVGAGAGPGLPYVREMDMVGLVARSAAERRGMVEEAIGLIRTLWSGESEFDGEHFMLSGATGFRRPDPPPAIIVGVNGPKLAAVAGKVAEGVNIHSYEPELGSLVEVARAAAGEGKLMITVEAPLAAEWLLDDHPSRQGLIAMGVDRLMLVWHATYGIEAIARAGRLLHP